MRLKAFVVGNFAGMVAICQPRIAWQCEYLVMNRKRMAFVTHNATKEDAERIAKQNHDKAPVVSSFVQQVVSIVSVP